MHYPTSPAFAVRALYVHRELIRELVKRDFVGRYKGSAVGVGWSLFNPLLMLTIYTFVFGVALKARWSGPVLENSSFATILFAGLIVHGLVAECLVRAPTLVSGTPNFVKKVIFPIEILGWVTMASALLHFAVSFVVLLVFCVVLGDGFGPGVLLVPLIILPLVLFTVGVTWAIASLGVYLRDLSQAMGIVITVLLFLSPVFYAMETLPPTWRHIMLLNPLSLPIEQMRDVVLWSRPLNWGAWLVSAAAGCAAFCAGFWWFQKTRSGFSDVI